MEARPMFALLIEFPMDRASRVVTMCGAIRAILGFPVGATIFAEAQELNHLAIPVLLVLHRAAPCHWGRINISRPRRSAIINHITRLSAIINHITRLSAIINHINAITRIADISNYPPLFRGRTCL